MKTITLFLGTNLAVLTLLGLILPMLGANNTVELLIFALIFGMGGSFISLALSKTMAKKMTGAHVIEEPSNSAEEWLFDTVRRQAQSAGIAMPEVAIYDSEDVNAFATGMNRNSALVAVTTGLLHAMEQSEVEAVLAHEVSHVANGDMVTLALIQGVINTFIFVLARVIGQIIDQVIFKNKQGYGPGYYIGSIIAEIVLGILASIIVMWFSRHREFHADAGSARLVGANKMISALKRLQMGHTGQLPDQLAAFGINASQGKSLMQSLFRSHPPLEDRIIALQQSRY
ncbi:protease HtpX [Candidatus Marithioploca araucensis]|uniref:Protease HtpX n=1 Tax=Candidatus Marithioploca araucensis TaxID=70273 RepID=A0ABT7VRU5_9GAMM|nr:protease HtpX [Candidatus Marithioploca araucensis]